MHSILFHGQTSEDREAARYAPLVLQPLTERQALFQQRARALRIVLTQQNMGDVAQSEGDILAISRLSKQAQAFGMKVTGVLIVLMSKGDKGQIRDGPGATLPIAGLPEERQALL